MTINIVQSMMSLILRGAIPVLFFGLVYVMSALFAEAASLGVSPSTGVYSANSTFTAKIVVNTAGKAVNAAEGTVTFNPRELSVVSVSRTGSIFSLWVADPVFSNSAGTIKFSGGLPSGYSGATGNIMTVTFKTLGTGATKVNFKDGSVLANDGKGTNVLTSMKGGTFTIQAITTVPEPERIVEYVAPVNTPLAPKIVSDTHPDSSSWYAVSQAELSWTLPAGIVAVRTALNSSPSAIPTKVYDDPIKDISLSDLSEGVSYFHIQLKNSDGWGKVAHYRLAVDTVSPSSIDIYSSVEADLVNPIQELSVDVIDELDEVRRFMVRIDALEPVEYRIKTGSSTLVLPALQPGYHTVIIEAFDQAGNSIVGTYSFTIKSFDKPIFTDYPSEINEEVIPVIKGMTRPRAIVEVLLSKVGAEPATYSVTSDDEGVFIFIPEGVFSTGVYELTARAIDEFGAVSELSEPVRIAVQKPGFLRIGSLIVSIMSIVVPLIVMLVLLVLGLWYLMLYARRFRGKVDVESAEALKILQREFGGLQTVLKEQGALMQSSRRTKKLTKAETAMIETFTKALQSSQEKVEKEIKDITHLANNKENN